LYQGQAKPQYDRPVAPNRERLARRAQRDSPAATTPKAGHKPVCHRPRLVPPVEALTPASAMPRNMEALGSLSMPSLSVAEVKNFFSTVLTWPRMRCWSIHLVKKMYQVPSDITARTTRMPREMIDPVAQIWPRP
jgi:hypothetical protein